MESRICRGPPGSASSSGMYCVPGSTSTCRGLKIKFTDSDLLDQFPDQVSVRAEREKTNFTKN